MPCSRATKHIFVTSGFTIALYETRRTIESLWSTVKGTVFSFLQHGDSGLTHPYRVDFIRQHPQYVAPDNAMNFLSDDGGAEYNLCMCTFFSFPAFQIDDDWAAVDHGKV